MYRNEEPPERIQSAVCEQCGRDVKSWINLILDDDGDWRCTSCRMGNLRSKKSWPGQRCDVLGCTLTAQDHMNEFRRIVTSSKWDEQFATKRDLRTLEEVPF